MRKTTYQVPEIRDENNNIIQEGTFGRRTAFVTADNHGVLDYLFNNIEALHDIATGAYLIFDSKDKFPSAGDTAKIYVSNADGKAYRWNGADYVYMGTESIAVTAEDVKNLELQAAASAMSAASHANNAEASASSAKEYSDSAAKSVDTINAKQVAIMECEGFKFVLNAADNGIDIVAADTTDAGSST